MWIVHPLQQTKDHVEIVNIVIIGREGSARVFGFNIKFID